MAKAILTGEDIEKFSDYEHSGAFTFFFAKLPWLAKYLFLRDRPRDRGNDDAQNDQPEDLVSDFHSV